jgi:hypothetical protein
MNRPHLIEAADLACFAPVEKLDSGAVVSRAGVRIADVDGEEFKEASLSAFPCPGDDRRQRIIRLALGRWLAAGRGSAGPMPPSPRPNPGKSTRSRLQTQ